MSAAERLMAHLVGKALVWLGKRAHDRGDDHLYRHALAALAVGDSSRCTPEECATDWPCWTVRLLDECERRGKALANAQQAWVEAMTSANNNVRAAEDRAEQGERERDHLANTLAGLRRVHGETVERLVDLRAKVTALADKWAADAGWSWTSTRADDLRALVEGDS